MSNKQKLKIDKSTHYIMIGIIAIVLFYWLFSGSAGGPDGIYYVGPSKDNSSYISFSPPNEYHSDYITWTGNKRNGTTNCATKGSYSYNSDNRTISVAGFYNSNCSSISSRNGNWKYDGSTITSPDGVVFRK